MKVLLDQGAPGSTAELLRAAGVDAVHTAEIGLSRAADDVILAEAAAQDRAVITLDADFHALLALSGASEPSVIRLRIQGLRAVELAALLLRILEQSREDLEQGAAISVTETRVRVHKLPIVR
jgi:predicted nuclease of predicted toxin-antitoxin system